MFILNVHSEIQNFKTSELQNLMPAGLHNGMTHSMEAEHMDVVK